MCGPQFSGSCNTVSCYMSGCVMAASQFNTSLNTGIRDILRQQDFEDAIDCPLGWCSVR